MSKIQHSPVPCGAEADGHDYVLLRRYGKFVQDLDLLQRTWVNDPVWLCMVRIAEWLRFDNDLEEAIVTEVLKPSCRHHFSAWKPNRWFTFSRPCKEIWWRVARDSLSGETCSKSELLQSIKRLLTLDPESEALLYAQLMFAKSKAPICTLLGPELDLVRPSEHVNDMLSCNLIFMRVLPLLNSADKRSLRMASRAYKSAHDKLLQRLETNVVPRDLAAVFPDLQEVVIRDRDLLTLDEDVVAPLQWLACYRNGIEEGIKLLAPPVLQALDDFPHLWLVLGAMGGIATLSETLRLLRALKSGGGILSVQDKLQFGGVRSLKVSTAEMTALAQLRHLRVFNDGWAGVDHLQDLSMLTGITQLKVTLELLGQLPELEAATKHLTNLKALHVRYLPASVKQQQALSDPDKPPPFVQHQHPHHFDPDEQQQQPPVPAVDAQLEAAVTCYENQPALTGLSFWQLGIECPDTLGIIGKLTQLSTLYLNLHSTALPESVMKAVVAPLANLASLTLSDIWQRPGVASEVEAEFVQALPGLQALTHLHMCGSRVAFGSPIVGAITQLRNLSVLEVHHCAVRQEFTMLSSMQKLQAMDCSDCWLTGYCQPSDFYATLKALTNLTSLDLSSCDALLSTQALCDCLAALPRLSYVDLSCSYEEADSLRFPESTVRWLVALLHDVHEVRVGGQVPPGRLEECFVQELRHHMGLDYEQAVLGYLKANPEGHPWLANQQLPIHNLKDPSAEPKHSIMFDDHGRPLPPGVELSMLYDRSYGAFSGLVSAGPANGGWVIVDGPEGGVGEAGPSSSAGGPMHPGMAAGPSGSDGQGGSGEGLGLLVHSLEQMRLLEQLSRQLNRFNKYS